MLTIKRRLFFICFLALQIMVAQQKGIDSLWKEYNNSSQPDTNRLKALSRLSWIYLQKNTDSSIIVTNRLLQLAIDTKHKIYCGDANSLLGMIYKRKNDYPKALSYLLKGAKINEECNNKVGMGSVYNTIAGLYNEQADYVKALEYYNKNLKILRETGSEAKILYTYINMGHVYSNMADYSKALDYYFRAAKKLEQSNDGFGIWSAYMGIGLVYESQSNYPKALEFDIKALRAERKVNDKKGLYECYLSLSSVYIKLSDFKLAEQYADSALQSAKAISSIEDESKSYKNFSEIFAKTGRFEEAYVNYVHFKQLADSVFNKDKSKEIGRLEAKSEFEKQEVEQRAEQEKKDLQTQLLLQRKNYWIYSLSAASVLLLLTVGFIYLFYHQSKLRNEQKSLQMEQKLLRSQMNPHFIFNCLGVIRSLIQKNENTKAEMYLTKFSKLVRSILEHSRTDAVSLEAEIETLRNYLEMQRLMFNQGFDYNIHVDENLDKENILIPSMLAQPFIENSLKHGLAHKSEKGLITVNFKKQGSSLLFEAIDSGVGFEKSEELKQQIKEHSSLATTITNERLALLNKRKSRQVTVEVKKILNEKNVLEGTMVSFSIPFHLAN